MKADPKLVQLCMARACFQNPEIQRSTGLSMQAIKNAIAGKNVRPATIGKIARALNVDVTEILADECLTDRG